MLLVCAVCRRNEGRKKRDMEKKRREDAEWEVKREKMGWSVEEMERIRREEEDRKRAEELDGEWERYRLRMGWTSAQMEECRRGMVEAEEMREAEGRLASIDGEGI